jgi:hypothetical protein
MKTHGLHLRDRHWPDWQTFKTHLRHLSHDPRFWAAVVLGGLVILMLIASFLAGRVVNHGTPPYGYPMYPYLP